MPRRTFASDNNSGVHPRVMEALARANDGGHVLAYGSDPWTERATRRFRDVFGEDAEVFFVFNGTAANVLSLKAMTQPYHAVLCAQGAHIDVDECGAPERFLGGKLVPIATPDGKLTPDLVAPHVKGVGVQHHVQPKVVSITNSTEVGTVYAPAEVRALADFAHARGMRLHVDGARIANAAAALGVGLRALTRDAGVDALSFGGAKNGLMYGEAVVLFDPALAEGFAFHRKQAMQLASKMRFVAAQFEALLEGDLWLESARHANRMARLLAEEAAKVPGVALSRMPQANAVFARLPPASIAPLQAEIPHYTWDEAAHEVRWVASFDTTEEDVRAFVDALRRHVAPRAG